MQSEIEHLKQPDALSAAVEQFGKDFPSIVKPLVTERDQYMVGARLGGWVAGWGQTCTHWLHTRTASVQLCVHALCCLPGTGACVLARSHGGLALPHPSPLPDTSPQVYVLRKLALYGDRVVAVVGAGHLKGIR